jgi:Transposase DDE domain group 1
VGFIVTTLTGTNRAVVRFYNQRGTAKQWIKEGKEATHWTRLSWHRFRANEVRLLLGVIAYNLGNLCVGSSCRSPSRTGLSRASSDGSSRRAPGSSGMPGTSPCNSPKAT